MWGCAIGTELCCFAAGQLSWTISVLTGLWSQVVLSVYHTGVILRLSSSVSLASSLRKHFMLAFSSRQVEQLLHVLFLASFFVRSLRPFKFILFFLIYFVHLVHSCPLSVTVKGQHQVVILTRMKRTIFLLFGSVPAWTSVCVWCSTRWLVPAKCRSKPINLQCHSTHCYLIALFTLNIAMETNTSIQGFLHKMHNCIVTYEGRPLYLSLLSSSGDTWGNLMSF